MSVLLTSELTKLYGRRVGVEAVDLALEEGTICGFLGPNGVGKTTTIRLLLGLLRPTAGKATIFGLDCWRDGRRIREEVGYVPGDLRLYPWLSARSALDLFGKIRRRDLMRSGFELVEEFGLDPDVRVRSMSRGMRQKLGLVLALAPDPRLLILDEPTASLDPVMQEKLKQRLLAAVARGRTVFFSSHTLAEVDRLCDRVVILSAGRVIADAAIADLRARARREVLLVWKDPSGSRSEPPACLQVEERQGKRWYAQLTGSSVELLEWLARQPLDDVVIGPPDMEALFQRYYQSGNDEPRADCQDDS